MRGCKVVKDPAKENIAVGVYYYYYYAVWVVGSILLVFLCVRCVHVGD